MDQRQQLEKPERMVLNDLAAEILLKENSDSEGSGEGGDEADNSIAIGEDEERRRRRAFEDEGNGIVMAPLLSRALGTRTRLAHREGNTFSILHIFNRHQKTNYKCIN
jgi:hypothetical protein